MNTNTAIAQAVLPLKVDAITKAAQHAAELIVRVKTEMEAGGWDLKQVAPYPHTNMSRGAFHVAIGRRNLFSAITEHNPDAPYDFHNRTEPRRASEARERQFIKECSDNAAAQYDAFVRKLEEKVGPHTAARLDGNHVWGYSILTVDVYDAKAPDCIGVQRWKTQQIVNVSKLGKVFNQWPSRKVK